MDIANIVYLLEELSKICSDAVSICQFRELNLIGIRKLLKKYDKYFKMTLEYNKIFDLFRPFSLRFMKQVQSNAKSNLNVIASQQVLIYLFFV